MSHAVLGTAGHIDHGKTSLVRALTGVDTDRLQEEKARGITIDLGFAELTGGPDGASMGVVDVPGHEAFVRTMVAGASGMDVVLLVVAADEGVMPQTREHLAVVELLGVPAMVVALAKADLVESEWLDLVTDDVADTLADGPFEGSPILPVSSVTGQGIEALRAALFRAADTGRHRRTEDLFRLPVDRVFTVQGTGTVVTGTIWSGRTTTGDNLRVLPGDARGRVRGLEVHGRTAEEAVAGRRTAVALTGADIGRAGLGRGHTLVGDAPWRESHMLTVRATVLPGSNWTIEHNQRLHVLVGTSEVRARCALLDGAPLEPGDDGWVQLRAESPVVARAGDRLVLRSYSPVETIGGARVAEPDAPKRRRMDEPTGGRLLAVLEGSAVEACIAVAELAGWEGVPVAEFPIRTGASPEAVAEALSDLVSAGGLQVGGVVVAATIVAEADARLLAHLGGAHMATPLEPVIGLAGLRPALPAYAPTGLADARLEKLHADGAVVMEEGGARLPDHAVRLSTAQERTREALLDLHREAGLAPPGRAEFPTSLAEAHDVDGLLRHLAADGLLVSLAEDVHIDATALGEGIATVRTLLGGRSGLGPADFREALPVTRKHLMPLLTHLDRIGVTVRTEEGRSVLRV